MKSKIIVITIIQILACYFGNVVGPLAKDFSKSHFEIGMTTASCVAFRHCNHNVCTDLQHLREQFLSLGQSNNYVSIIMSAK
jgi:hypothetical protein